jgi:hypothetical protein
MMLTQQFNPVALYRAVGHIAVTKQPEHSALCTCVWYMYCPAAFVKFLMQDKMFQSLLLYQRMDVNVYFKKLV